MPDTTIDQYRQFLDAIFRAPDTFAGVLDLDGTLIEVNRNALDFINCDAGEVIGKPFPETPWWTHSSDLKTRLERSIPRAADGEYISFEANHVSDDGTVIFVDFLLIPVRDYNGDVQYLLSEGRDITDRIFTERQLDQEQELFQTLFHAIPDPIYFKNANHEFVRVNYAKARKHNTTPDEMIGKTDFDYYPEDLAREAHNTDQYVLQNGTPVIGKEEQVLENDGTIRWNLVTKLPRRNSRGEIIGTMGISRDITELKQTEQQLVEAQRMEALGELASGIAHDFNNVLAMISGALQLMWPELKASDLKKYAEMIESGVTQGSSITERLLAFSRPREPELKPLSVREFLGDIREFASHTLPQNISIVIDDMDQRSSILAEKSQLQQVLMTLCINAADAMPEGGTIRLGVSDPTEAEVRENHPQADCGYLCITVSDTGIGMDEETQEKIFKPFFSTKDHDDGTGLGLTVARKIIRNHNGWIEMESEPGAGTTFTIGLPETAPDTRSETVEQASHLPEGEGEHLLLVEDEEVIRNILAEILTNNGYRVTAKQDGFSALRSLRENPKRFSLVVTDLGLPDMDGEVLADSIRQDAPDLPIVVITGYVSPERFQRLEEQGLDELVRKPNDLEEVLEAVARLLNKI